MERIEADVNKNLERVALEEGVTNDNESHRVTCSFRCFRHSCLLTCADVKPEWFSGSHIAIVTANDMKQFRTGSNQGIESCSLTLSIGEVW